MAWEFVPAVFWQQCMEQQRVLVSGLLFGTRKFPFQQFSVLLEQKSLNAQAGRSHFSKIDSDEFGKIGGRPRNYSRLKAGWLAWEWPEKISKPPTPLSSPLPQESWNLGEQRSHCHHCCFLFLLPDKEHRLSFFTPFCSHNGQRGSAPKLQVWALNASGWTMGFGGVCLVGRSSTASSDYPVPWKKTSLSWQNAPQNENTLLLLSSAS